MENSAEMISRKDTFSNKVRYQSHEMKQRFDMLAGFRVYVSVTGLALLLEGFFTGAGKLLERRLRR